MMLYLPLELACIETRKCRGEVHIWLEIDHLQEAARMASWFHTVMSGWRRPSFFSPFSTHSAPGDQWGAFAKTWTLILLRPIPFRPGSLACGTQYLHTSVTFGLSQALKEGSVAICLTWMFKARLIVWIESDLLNESLKLKLNIL